VLESHGWILHRVWSVDWFQRPAEQLDVMIAKIEAAKEEHDAVIARAARAAPIDIVAIEREDVTEIGLVPIGEEPAATTIPYVEATLSRPSHCADELHETPIGILIALVEEAVRIEGPVHADEVVSRIRDAWGLRRAGNRIQQAVEAAIDAAVTTGRLEKVAFFLSVPNAPVRIRDRSAASSQTLRRADMLPPSEIRVAVLDVVRNNLGATSDQIVQAVSRMFGIKSTSAAVRDVIQKQIDEALEAGLLTAQAGVLTAAADDERPSEETAGDSSYHDAPAAVDLS
jgi:hypothetical protein